MLYFLSHLVASPRLAKALPWGILLVLAVTAALGAYKGLQALGAAKASIKQLEQRVQQQRQQLHTLQRGVQVHIQRNQVLEAELNAALAENPDWSDAAVPGGIRDRLCRNAACRDSAVLAP